MKKDTKIKTGIGVAAVGASLLFNGCVTPANAGWFEAPPSKVAKRAMERGMAAEARGDEAEAKAAFEKARENYAKAVESHPGWLSYQTAYALACLKSGLFSDAVKACDKLQESNRAKDVPRSFVIKGAALLAMGNPQASLKAWKSYPFESDQAILGRAVAKQVAAMESGSSVDFDSALSALESAMDRQAVENGRNGSGGTDSGDTGNSGGAGASSGGTTSGSS